MKKISYVPIFYLAYVFSNFCYLSLISISPLAFGVYLEVSIRVAFFGLCLFVLNKYYINFRLKTVLFSSWLLLGLIMMVILIRFPLYFPLTDDVGFHLIAGDYARTIWTNNNFLPMNYATYLYPLADMVFTPFLYLFGIRFTMLLNGLVLGIWFFSLANRFSNNNKNFGWVFIYIFFVPHLVATQMSFMSDFLALLLFLEMFYQVLYIKDKTLGFILGVLSLVIKQSTGLFEIPIILYLILKNRSKINWKLFFGFGVVLSVFFVRSYFETGNPIALLLNSFFRSSLYPTLGNLDNNWGSKTLVGVLLWPVIGQFTNKYAEGLVSFFSMRFYLFFTALPYVTSIIMFLWKKKFKYLIIFISFLFWSAVSGYGRYQIPFVAVSWIWLIIDLKYNFISNKLVLIIFACLCCVSITTDYGWRPIPFKNVFHFLPWYKQGLAMVFKDKPSDFVESMKDEFVGYDLVMTNIGGQTKFISYNANALGLRLIDAIVTKNDYLSIMNDKKINQNIKNNLSYLHKAKRILFLTEPYSVQGLNNLYLFKVTDCKQVGIWKSSPLLQNDYFFENTLKYDCVPKK